ncbi:hypothetical protein ACI0FR_03219 [Paenochrobactrum sp. BZR 201-1]
MTSVLAPGFSPLPLLYLSQILLKIPKPSAPATVLRRLNILKVFRLIIYLPTV